MFGFFLFAVAYFEAFASGNDWKETMCFLKTDRCQDSKNWYIFRLNTFDQTYFEIVFCHSLIKTEIENEKKWTAYGQLVNGYLCCFVRLFKHKTILSRRFLILQTPFVLFFAIYCFVTCDSSENLCQRSKAIRFLYFCFLDTDTQQKRREKKNNKLKINNWVFQVRCNFEIVLHK